MATNKQEKWRKRRNSSNERGELYTLSKNMKERREYCRDTRQVLNHRWSPNREGRWTSDDEKQGSPGLHDIKGGAPGPCNSDQRWAPSASKKRRCTGNEKRWSLGPSHKKRRSRSKEKRKPRRMERTASTCDGKKKRWSSHKGTRCSLNNEIRNYYDDKRKQPFSPKDIRKSLGSEERKYLNKEILSYKNARRKYDNYEGTSSPSNGRKRWPLDTDTRSYHNHGGKSSSSWKKRLPLSKVRRPQRSDLDLPRNLIEINRKPLELHSTSRSELELAPKVWNWPHIHTCYICGHPYRHYHRYRYPYHRQHPGQCPNPSCLAFHKGFNERHAEQVSDRELQEWEKQNGPEKKHINC